LVSTVTLTSLSRKPLKSLIEVVKAEPVEAILEETEAPFSIKVPETSKSPLTTAFPLTWNLWTGALSAEKDPIPTLPS